LVHSALTNAWGLSGLSLSVIVVLVVIGLGPVMACAAFWLVNEFQVTRVSPTDAALITYEAFVAGIIATKLVVSSVTHTWSTGGVTITIAACLMLVFVGYIHMASRWTA